MSAQAWTSIPAPTPMAQSPRDEPRATSRVEPPVASCVEPLVAVLMELAHVVSSISDDHYTRANATAFGGTIGGHVRHSLDHVAALVAGIDCGKLNYDDRQRGTAVESDRFAAVDGIQHAVGRLRTLPDDAMDRTIQVSTALTANGPAMAMQCPARRELAFVLSHTVHHNAMIGAMVRALGGSTPPRFGYAPSTIAHLNRQQQDRPCRHADSQLQQEQQQQ